MELRDERSGSITSVTPRVVVSSAGAWAAGVASLVGVSIPMQLSKGSMLIYSQRMSDTSLTRCRIPTDGDAIAPVHTVSILGATSILVDSPDRIDVDRDEVEALIREGEMLVPALRRMRILRAYAGVRPLYGGSDADEPDATGGRQTSRNHVVIDHGADGVANFVSVIGGKLTTFRLMAQDTADVVCAKLGVTASCTTADAALLGQADGRTYWLGHRFAEHEAAGGGDADLVCECELVTRETVDVFLHEHPDCSIDDIRRGTRLGMGPCQGAFCAFRMAGILAQDTGVTDPAGLAARAERAILGFLAERFRGITPIAAGFQLQEMWMTAGIYAAILGEAALSGLDGVGGDGASKGDEASHGQR